MERRGVRDPVQATFGCSDGETLWAVRYASAGAARTLFASAEAATICRLHPENPRFQRLTPEDRLIVSEPCSDLPGIWHEIRQSSAVTVARGDVFEERAFSPRAVAV